MSFVPGNLGSSLCHPDKPWVFADLGSRPGKAIFSCLQQVGGGPLKEQPSSVLGWERPWTFVSGAVSRLGFPFFLGSADWNEDGKETP